METRATAALALVLAVVVPAAALAQGPLATLRVALVSEGVVGQQRDLPGVLERGIVDRVVVGSGRDVISRGSLLAKPIRAVGGPEAAGLGGRGEFAVVAVRPPTGAAAWTEVDVAARGDRPDDVLVLEVGGELSTFGQVLDAIFVEEPGGRLAELPVEPVALVPGRGVLALPAPFGRPVGALRPPDPLPKRRVRRSPRDQKPRGGDGGRRHHAARAGRCRAPLGGRVAGGGTGSSVRLPVAALRAGPPRLALSWKDRIVLGPVGEGR